MKLVFWIDAALILTAAVLIQITDESKYRKYAEEEAYTARFRTDQYSFSEKVVFHLSKFFSRFVNSVARYLFNAFLLVKKMFVDDAVVNLDNLRVVADMFSNANDMKEHFWDMISLFFRNEL